jgi:hypothetical protein
MIWHNATQPRVWTCGACRRTTMTTGSPAPALPPDWLGVRTGERIEPFCSLDCIRRWMRAGGERAA